MPTVLIGPDERVAVINPPAQVILGPSAQGRHYITALRQPALLDAVEGCLQDGQSRTSPYQQHDQGQDALWHVTLSTPRLEDKPHVLLTFQDVTAVKGANKMRRDFVANVSHELKTPLTAVRGYIETLQGAAREDTQARDRFLNGIDTETQRMAVLVDDLLSLSRVEEEQRVRPTAQIDLRSITQTTLDRMDTAAKAQGMTLTLDAPAATYTAPGDARQIGQVVSNLVSNAIKYGRPDSTVTITLSGPSHEPAVQGPAISLIVHNDGPGIPAHHIGRLTERFYRIDNHRSREVGGTGLGLAIVKHIVTRHRGRLRIESDANDGTTVSAVFPSEI